MCSGILFTTGVANKQKEAFDQNAEVVGENGDATKVAIYDNGYNLGDAKPMANVHGATSDSTVEVNLTLLTPEENPDKKSTVSADVEPGYCIAH